ncbi:heat-inducible transcriptional repressor HrcA [Anaerorhabdus furcosa]|uniref:Heat-inducible transcription repressor HrcA n=1 Tax=Anaerorhabdus furcosa TaxID=118967 RepID=A0A1T4N4Q8_9FIRM|nr:heat-inducible transcriptional repressor HrcA [Anaerorhabdus furcosa]SJZ74106.1 heat-inducible transcription repressor HrcA [Anaerorhabdus furcosa]
MLTQRRIDIFRAIVDEFIQSAEPVGSKTLMEKYDLPYSSATIRNDMQFLEELGYLEKTHTSSGRIPSTLGYKFYCENLLEAKIDPKMELAIQDLFVNHHLNLDEVIMQSCNILSQMTNLTTGVLGPDASMQRLEHIKIFPINERSAVCVFITDNGHTENRTFNFNDDVSIQDIEQCCSILNDRLKGTYIHDVVERMQALKPILAENVVRHEMLFQAFVKAFMKFASENVYFSGKNNLLYQPEFADIEKLKQLMTMLDNRSLWRQLGKQSQELVVKTQEGSKMVWVDDVAVVSSKFRVSDSEEGELMVVGPTRMDYDKVASLLEYVSSTIEKFYGNGGKHGR